jgi:hypothetical protein
MLLMAAAAGRRGEAAARAAAAVALIDLRGCSAGGNGGGQLQRPHQMQVGNWFALKSVLYGSNAKIIKPTCQQDTAGSSIG